MKTKQRKINYSNIYMNGGIINDFHSIIQFDRRALRQYTIVEYSEWIPGFIQSTYKRKCLENP